MDKPWIKWLLIGVLVLVAIAGGLRMVAGNIVDSDDFRSDVSGLIAEALAVVRPGSKVSVGTSKLGGLSRIHLGNIVLEGVGRSGRSTVSEVVVTGNLLSWLFRNRRAFYFHAKPAGGGSVAGSGIINPAGKSGSVTAAHVSLRIDGVQAGDFLGSSKGGPVQFAGGILAGDINLRYENALSGTVTLALQNPVFAVKAGPLGTQNLTIADIEVRARIGKEQFSLLKPVILQGKLGSVSIAGGVRMPDNGGHELDLTLGLKGGFLLRMAVASFFGCRSPGLPDQARVRGTIGSATCTAA